MEYSNPGLPAGPLLTLQDGTPLRMRLARNLSSAESQAGDRVDFEVLDEVRVGNAVIIASGAIAIATVTDAEAKRSLGRAGRLDVTLDYVRSVSGEKVRLRGVQDTKGGGHTGAMTGAMVATAVVFWPAAPLFLFMKGKDVKIPKGHEVTVYVNGDQQVRGLATAAPTAPSVVAQGEKPAPHQTSAGRPMTNEDVLTLKGAGFGEEFIITKIKASTSGFSLDTPDLVKLKQAGLSDAVIGAMVQAGGPR
jgi:antitoxin (DNA-binding transcriptional repressor) of toxin-antitoxin stability system